MRAPSANEVVNLPPPAPLASVSRVLGCRLRFSKIGKMVAARSQSFRLPVADFAMSLCFVMS
jgi:hypothetical protein